MVNLLCDACSLTSFVLYEAYGTRPYEWGDDPDRQKANTKEEESDLGLLNEGYRFRDLETGVFLTRDPIGYGDGPNVYCYVRANPIMAFDPLGLFLETDQSDDMEDYFDENGIEDYIYDEDRGGYTFGDDSSYDKDSLASEILYGLINSDRTFSIADSATDNLKTHVAAREGIVDYASQKQYGFGAGDKTSMNPDSGYWKWDANAKLYVPNTDNADRATIFGDVNKNSDKYTMACRQATLTTMIGGTLLGTGNSTASLMTAGGVKSNDWIPGDMGYVKNTDFTEGVDTIGTEGENIIYTGQGEAWGHSSSDNTYKPIYMGGGGESWVGTVNGWSDRPNSAVETGDRGWPSAGLR